MQRTINEDSDEIQKKKKKKKKSNYGLFGMMVRVFTNSPGFNPSSSHTKNFKKWYLMPPCLTQHYKLWIKSKVEQSKERSSTLPYTLV